MTIIAHPTLRLEFFSDGQRLFNSEEYFEAHEIWERLWKVEHGSDKNTIQGLIQVAAHLLHLKKKNWSGAQSVAALAREKLNAPLMNKSRYEKIDLQPLLSALDYNIQVLASRKETELSDRDFLFPKLLEK